jgi:hypothetical protein
VVVSLDLPSDTLQDIAAVLVALRTSGDGVEIKKHDIRGFGLFE